MFAPQFMLSIMSLIPKKEPGIVSMIACMASGWRLDRRESLVLRHYRSG